MSTASDDMTMLYLHTTNTIGQLYIVSRDLLVVDVVMILFFAANYNSKEIKIHHTQYVCIIINNIYLGTYLNINKLYNSYRSFRT